MQPLIQPRLINDPFGDPGVLLEFRHQRRAMLFDLGDLAPIAPRQLLRVDAVFVSHMHMDHFSGFDRLLRTLTGRDKLLRLFGPEGFIDKVEHKLQAYEWNLIHTNPRELVLDVYEYRPPEILANARFSSRGSFRRQDGAESRLSGNILLKDRGLIVRTAVLDHGIPSLAFSIEEPIHVNVWRERLEAMGLGVGPWLKDAKLAVLRGLPEDTEILASWRTGGEPHERTCSLGELIDSAFSTEPGQKIAYVVDAVLNEENSDRIVALAEGADCLFIETTFLEKDAEIARARKHLTARQAGDLARRAGVRKLVPLHYSPRYKVEKDLLWQEVMEAFAPR